MLTFIAQNLATIIVSIVIIVIVALVIGKMVRDRRKGKVCGCDCGNCAASSTCHSQSPADRQ